MKRHCIETVPKKKITKIAFENLKHNIFFLDSVITYRTIEGNKFDNISNRFLNNFAS